MNDDAVTNDAVTNDAVTNDAVNISVLHIIPNVRGTNRQCYFGNTAER